MDAHGDPNEEDQAAHAETFESSPCREENGHATHSGGRGTRQESTSRSPRRTKLQRSTGASSKTLSPTPLSRIGYRKRLAGRGGGEPWLLAAACMPRKGLPRSSAHALK